MPTDLRWNTRRTVGRIISTRLLRTLPAIAFLVTAFLAAPSHGLEAEGPGGEPPVGGALVTLESAPPPTSTGVCPRDERRASTGRGARRAPLTATPIDWRPSVAVGRPDAGRLVRGVKLAHEGRHFLTWDPIRKRSPNRFWRRYGTDRLVRSLLRVTTRNATAHPSAPRVLIGDLSRPRGGDFGVRYGKVGHASHQNGLDVDVYYPRRDERERAPLTIKQVDLRLAQDLVDRFVAAGAKRVFVGPATGLRGPPGVVQVVPGHDNHLHVRLPATRR